MTTLNSNQQHSYSIALQLARFLRKSKRVYATVTPFQSQVKAFLHHLNNIPAQAAIKAKKGKAITAQKKDLKKQLARETAEICALATVYALDTNDFTLLRYVNISYTNIYTTKDSLLYHGINFIKYIISPCFDKEDFKSYGITAATLASVTGKAKQFHKSISDGKWINWESDMASRNITATLKKIKVSIKQLNRLLILFKETHPVFIQDFQQALTITQTTKAHNTLEGTVTSSNTGQPLKGVTITLEGSTKTAVTNISGFYHLTGLKVGMQKITIAAEGSTPQTINVKIIRGKTITQNIQLQTNSFILPASEVA